MGSPTDLSAPRSASPEPRGRLSRIVEDGVLAGIIGAAAVAFWFLVLDSVRGHPFFTPSLLGSVVFQGLEVEAVTSVSTVMVFAYTGLHGLLFLIAGAVLAWMVSEFEENPQIGLVLLLLFVLFEAVIFGLEVTIVPNLVGALGAWAVALANLLAAVAMFWFLLMRHPNAVARLRESWND
jgi:hypothetical protein